MTIAKKRINLNMITKRFWFLIGAFAILSAGVMGVNAYLSKKPVPATETPEEITEESTVTEPEESTSTVSDVSEEISLNPEIDTSDWMTYRNAEHRYEVKYPNAFVIEESSYGTKFLSQKDTKLEHLPHAPHYMFIHIEETSPQENLENWLKEKFWLNEIKEFKGNPSAETNYVDLIEKIVIGNNIQGYKVHHWVQASDECVYCLYHQSQNKKIEISRLNEGPLADPYRSCVTDPIFEQMLSTLRFLE